MGALKPPNNDNTVVGSLAVDGWAATFGTARRGQGGLQSCGVSSWLYQMYPHHGVVGMRLLLSL